MTATSPRDLREAVLAYARPADVEPLDGRTRELVEQAYLRGFRGRQRGREGYGLHADIASGMAGFNVVVGVPTPVPELAKGPVPLSLTELRRIAAAVGPDVDPATLAIPWRHLGSRAHRAFLTMCAVSRYALATNLVLDSDQIKAIIEAPTPDSPGAESIESYVQRRRLGPYGGDVDQAARDGVRPLARWALADAKDPEVASAVADDPALFDRWCGALVEALDLLDQRWANRDGWLHLANDIAHAGKLATWPTDHGPALAIDVALAGVLRELGDNDAASEVERKSAERVRAWLEFDFTPGLDLEGDPGPAPGDLFRQWWGGKVPAGAPTGSPAVVRVLWAAWKQARPSFVEALDRRTRKRAPAMFRGELGQHHVIVTHRATDAEGGVVWQSPDGAELTRAIAAPALHHRALADTIRGIRKGARYLRTATAERFLCRYLPSVGWSRWLAGETDARSLVYPGRVTEMIEDMERFGFPVRSGADRAKIGSIALAAAHIKLAEGRWIADVRGLAGRGQRGPKAVPVFILLGYACIPPMADHEARRFRKGAHDRHLLPVPPDPPLDLWSKGQMVYTLLLWQWEVEACMRAHPLAYRDGGVEVRALLSEEWQPVAGTVTLSRTQREEALDRWAAPDGWLRWSSDRRGDRGRLYLRAEPAHAMLVDAAAQVARGRAAGRQSARKKRGQR